MSAVYRALSDRLLTDPLQRRAGRTRQVVGAIALGGLAVLGTIGVALGGGPAPSGPSAITIKDVATSTISSDASTSTTTSASASPAASSKPPPAPSPLDKLYSVLPPGYNSTVCGPSNEPAPQALATVDCRELDITDGPTSGRFSLFADADALASQFQISVNSTAISQCPDDIDSPLSWHYPATPAFSAGSLACGTQDNVPDLMWTKDDVLLLAEVRGSSLDNLYGWWLSLG